MSKKEYLIVYVRFFCPDLFKTLLLFGWGLFFLQGDWWAIEFIAPWTLWYYWSHNAGWFQERSYMLNTSVVVFAAFKNISFNENFVHKTDAGTDHSITHN